MNAQRAWCLLLILASAPSPAANDRFTLRTAHLEASPTGEGRFRLRARLAAEERSGELRESARFTLLGRMAKAGQACAGSEGVFANGFEG